MPYEIFLNSDETISYVKYSGKVIPSDSYRAFKQRYADKEKLAKYKVVISDYSNVTEVVKDELMFGKIIDINLDASKYNFDIFFIAIMPKDFQFGVGRMWQAYVEKTTWEISICRTREEALNYLKQKNNKFDMNDILFA